MEERSCALAAETKLETPEGPLTVRGLAGKSVPVFVRDEGGHVRFRVSRNVQKVAEAAPVVKIVLETGESFRVGPEQVLFKKGMVEVQAADLQAGDELVPMFHYPEGYVYSDSTSGREVASSGATRVASVESSGTADLYALEVDGTGVFFVAAGVLCRAAGYSAD